MSLTREVLEAKKQQISSVPCGFCRACCTHDRVVLGPADDPKAFRWHVEDGYAVLDRQADGACVYLTAEGCGIHERAPLICRRFDCRVLFLLTPEAVRRRREAQNPQMAQVYDAGRERASTLTAD